MKAEILAVGNEILYGDILNSNAKYISQQLYNLGFDVVRHVAVGDYPEQIKEELDASKADIVIATGGLGPTYDDLTKETIAEYLGIKLVLHQPSLTAMERFFARRGVAMAHNNYKQALLPEGCTVFDNPNGTAPGGGINVSGKAYIFLPGPPREMAPMFEESAVPFILGFANEKSDIESVSMNIFGIGESSLEEVVGKVMTESGNPRIAPYAGYGECRLRVTARGETKEEAQRLVDSGVQSVRSIIGEFVYDIDSAGLHETLFKRLLKEKKTISFAESCTGGYCAKRITDLSGSSEVFGCGIVSYSNEIKMSVLGVKKETLESFGAVSFETSREMAEGIARISGADICVGVTGVAGPSGGSEDKPVGTVYVTLCRAGKLYSKRLNLSGRDHEREFVRLQTTNHVYSMALKLLDGSLEDEYNK